MLCHQQVRLAALRDGVRFHERERGPNTPSLPRVGAQPIIGLTTTLHGGDGTFNTTSSQMENLLKDHA
jgi:hypothetical protein